MELITAEQMQEIDCNAIEKLGIPGAVLMENAGRAAAGEILSATHGTDPGPVLVLAGPGNNGGDGYVIARILADRGWQVRTLVLAEESRISGDAALMLNILQKLQAELYFIRDEEELQAEFARIEPLLIVDALLGTGLSQGVRGLYLRAVELVNQAQAQVVAVDIPSGVNGSDGRIMGAAVRAGLTLCFDTAKIGHATRPGSDCVGELRVLEIGIPQFGRSECKVSLVDEAEARALLPLRPASGHKGTFGHLGVVAGSTGMSGAAVLCCEAALRSGGGLVTLACPAALYPIVETKLTEVMTLPLGGKNSSLGVENCAEIVQRYEEWQALVIGPGLGQGPQAFAAVRELFTKCHKPLVLDADGLNALVGHTDLFQRRNTETPILTPHPGEFSRLTGLNVAEIEAERFSLARQFALEHQVVLLLKGERTLIAAPDGRVRINSSGNVGLATGGSGDVLSGLIGGLLAQGLSAFDAASLGAWLHGAAADLLAEEIGGAGMLAGEISKYIPVARHQLEGVTLCR